MTSSLLRSPVLRRIAATLRPTAGLPIICRAKHTVRVILQQDLPQGQAYSGDVRHVAAGYARNYLIPQKMALYATRQNFARLDIKDPEQETAEERKERLARERLASEDQDLKAANILKNYLRNKVVCTHVG
jgi:ribosomal protein L9